MQGDWSVLNPPTPAAPVPAPVLVQDIAQTGSARIKRCGASATTPSSTTRPRSATTCCRGSARLAVRALDVAAVEAFIAGQAPARRLDPVPGPPALPGHAPRLAERAPRALRVGDQPEAPRHESGRGHPVHADERRRPARGPLHDGGASGDPRTRPRRGTRSWPRSSGCGSGRGCARARSWASNGTTSTSTPAPCWFDGPSAADGSGPPRPGGSGPSRWDTRSASRRRSGALAPTPRLAPSSTASGASRCASLVPEAFVFGGGQTPIRADQLNRRWRAVVRRPGCATGRRSSSGIPSPRRSSRGTRRSSTCNGKAAGRAPRCCYATTAAGSPRTPASRRPPERPPERPPSPGTHCPSEGRCRHERPVARLTPPHFTPLSPHASGLPVRSPRRDKLSTTSTTPSLPTRAECAGFVWEPVASDQERGT